MMFAALLLVADPAAGPTVRDISTSAPAAVQARARATIMSPVRLGDAAEGSEPAPRRIRRVPCPGEPAPCIQLIADIE